jgi:hypothetical protein
MLINRKMGIGKRFGGEDEIKNIIYSPPFSKKSIIL